MDKKTIIKLAVKYVTDEITDTECITVLNFSPEELDLFSKIVKNLSPKRA